MNKQIIRTVLLLGLYGVSNSASAVLIKYDFSSFATNTTLTPSKVFSSASGLNVTATAVFAPAPTETNGIGVVADYGLYVCSQSPCGFDENYSNDGDDYFPVDGIEFDEGISFTFGGEKVRLISAEFFIYDSDNTYDSSNPSYSNNFDYREGATTVQNERVFWTTCAVTDNDHNNGIIRTCDFTAGSMTPSSLVSEFSLWADWKKDAFKVRSITVDRPGTNKVPEPTGLALLGASLLGFAAARRRRR